MTEKLEDCQYHDSAWKCGRAWHTVRESCVAYQLAGHRPNRICPICGWGVSSTEHDIAVGKAVCGTAREIMLITLGNLDADVCEY